MVYAYFQLKISHVCIKNIQQIYFLFIFFIKTYLSIFEKNRLYNKKTVLLAVFSVKSLFFYFKSNHYVDIDIFQKYIIIRNMNNIKKQNSTLDTSNILFEDDKEANTFLWKTHRNLGYPAKFHTAMEIYFVNEGTMGADINGISYTVSAGDIIIVNPLEIHKYENTGFANVSVFIFDNNYLADFKEIYNNKIFPTHLTDKEYNKEIYNILSKIPTSFTNNTTLSELAKKGYINLLLDTIIKRYNLIDSTNNQDSIMKIVNYIYRNINNKITLDTLAKEFNYTKTSISRLISKYLKTDLRRFVNDIRAEQVRALLKNEKYNNVSVLDIALSCGFDSAATFYRSYKRRFMKLPERKN